MYCLIDLEARSPGVDNVGVLGRTCFNLSTGFWCQLQPLASDTPPISAFEFTGLSFPCLSARGILLSVPLCTFCEDTSHEGLRAHFIPV